MAGKDYSVLDLKATVELFAKTDVKVKDISSVSVFHSLNCKRKEVKEGVIEVTLNVVYKVTN